jgi:hypothetical protein
MDAVSISRKGASHERRFREANERRSSSGMVDCSNRRCFSHYSMDCVSSGHVRSSRMAVVLVWAKHHLVFSPDRVVLGHSRLESMHLASGVGGSLADAMGMAVEETSRWLIQRRSSRAADRRYQTRDRLMRLSTTSVAVQVQAVALNCLDADAVVGFRRCRDRGTIKTRPPSNKARDVSNLIAARTHEVAYI